MRPNLRVQLLALHYIPITAQTCVGYPGGEAPNGEGEPILHCENPLRAPSPNDLIEDSRNIGSEPPASAHRKLVYPARVKDVGNVITAVSVVLFEPKAWKKRGALDRAFANLQGIAVVGFAERTGIVRKHVQTVAEPAIEASLETMVVGVCVGDYIVAVAGKIGKRNKVLRVGSRR